MCVWLFVAPLCELLILMFNILYYIFNFIEYTIVSCTMFQNNMLAAFSFVVAKHFFSFFTLSLLLLTWVVISIIKMFFLDKHNTAHSYTIHVVMYHLHIVIFCFVFCRILILYFNLVLSRFNLSMLICTHCWSILR